MDTHLIKLAFGIIGNIIGVGVNLAPMPTFWRIYTDKDTQGFSALPYVSALGSALLWVLFGLPMVTKNALMIITINVASCLLQIFYITVFLTYAVRKTRIHVIKIMAACFVYLATAAVLTLVVVPPHARSQTVGCLCVLVGIITYASPLTVAKMVIDTRSVEFLPILLCVFFLINSSVWSCYGIFTKDIFILIPNGLGVVFGVAQIALYAAYRNATPFDDFSNSCKVVETPTDVFAKTPLYTPNGKLVNSGGNHVKTPSHPSQDASNGNLPV